MLRFRFLHYCWSSIQMANHYYYYVGWANTIWGGALFMWGFNKEGWSHYQAGSIQSRFTWCGLYSISVTYRSNISRVMMEQTTYILKINARREDCRVENDSSLSRFANPMFWYHCFDPWGMWRCWISLILGTSCIVGITWIAIASITLASITMPSNMDP